MMLGVMWFHCIMLPFYAVYAHGDILEFWNRWTLGLDLGPGNAGLWTEISTQKTNKIWYNLYGTFTTRVHQILCVLGPKSRTRVQHFQVRGPDLGFSNSQMPPLEG